MKFKKWNDLQQFHEVIKNLNYPRIYSCVKDAGFKITYGLKTKLHGTNAGVVISPTGEVKAQKRSQLIQSGDNYGFRNWVESNERYFESLAAAEYTTYIYGEWAGPGIQDNVSVSQIPNKMFFVFAIDYVDYEGNLAYRVYDPELIEERLSVSKIPNDDIIVIPYIGKYTINFENKTEADTTLGLLNELVNNIGNCDPLIKDLFDIEGCGEGVVAYPLLGRERGYYMGDEEYFGWLNFKAKSEAHRVNKTKHAVAYDPEKFANANRFADSYVTEQRLEQGLREGVDGELDMRRTGDFIKWVVRDIHKEAQTELAASPELDWKAVSKTCSTRAVLWYKKKVTGQ